VQTPSPAASCPPAIAADALNGVGGLVLTRGPDLDARLRYHTSEIDNGPALPGDRMTVTSGRQDTVAVTEVNRVVNIDRRDRKGASTCSPDAAAGRQRNDATADSASSTTLAGSAIGLAATERNHRWPDISVIDTKDDLI
jgi:hypothetical protein